ncbi:phosphoribosylanthranilate isomerase [Aestuariivivens sediminicola]|uniref:phosphoribosylanthranilate isomerase n=1 Tax=Aestuariivivens sediminicola TaxID=2913560 RepID=UPI001F584168|nr:phosphoribosylanthranilate isomerase [Aestuariivivens sediminicola]
MKLKICGMKYEDNMKQVAALEPDYLGFIFYKKSARYFSGDLPELPESIKKVGVFVDAELEDVINKIATYNLQAVQLHGNETPEYCMNLSRMHTEIEIIKVFSIKDRFNFEVLDPYEPVCHYFLFDTKGALPGGNGYTFNWNVLNSYPSTKPFFLSGGIGLDEMEKLNKFKASKASRYCKAIDVNSKFEIEPGLKSVALLKAFNIKRSQI